MNTPSMSPKKDKKILKNTSLPSDLVRAINVAVETGLAKDFSDAVEQGLRLILKSEGYPDSLTEDELRAGLTKLKPSEKRLNEAALRWREGSKIEGEVGVDRHQDR